MGIFNTENKEMQFNKELANKQHDHEQNIETFKASSQDDQTALQMQSERTDLLKWQQDLDPELQKFIHKLRGEILINNAWVPKSFWQNGKLVKIKPLCNEKFISDVIEPQCSPFLDRNLFNTWYEGQDILDSLKNTCDDIADVMADHYDAYGIDFTDYGIIMRNIKNVIRPGAYRALKGWTKKIDSSIIRRVEQSNDTNEKEKRGILDVFKRGIV
ncbi:MAG: hypothetical protein KKD01_19505 [Proteobacteria bacterium]|nr:hypothetical protein [Pseudomonadota bacterium]